MFDFDGLVMLVVTLGVLALAVWAFVDALVRPAPAYVAAGKLTKPAWMGIPAVAALIIWFMGPLSFLGLPAVIAAVVYLVDVRPAVRGLKRGGGNDTYW